MLAQMIETTAKELFNEWVDLIFENNQQLPVDQWKEKILNEGAGIFDKDKLLDNVSVESTWPFCEGEKAEKRKRFLDSA